MHQPQDLRPAREGLHYNLASFHHSRFAHVIMSIGSFALPIPALIFMFGVAVVFTMGWLMEKRHGSIEADVLMILAAGLVAARIAFAIRFLPQYRHDMIAVLDIRDLGFDPLTGVVAGALMTG